MIALSFLVLITAAQGVTAEDVESTTFVTVGLGNVGRYVTQLGIENGMTCVGAVKKRRNIGDDIGKYIGLNYELGVTIDSSDNLDQLLMSKKPNVIFFTITDTNPNTLLDYFRSVIGLSNQENNPDGNYFNIITSDVRYWYPWRSKHSHYQEIISEIREVHKLAKDKKISILGTGLQDNTGDSFIGSILSPMVDKTRDNLNLEYYLKFNANGGAYRTISWLYGPSDFTGINVSKHDAEKGKIISETLPFGVEMDFFGSQYFYRMLDPNGEIINDEKYLDTIIKNENVQCNFIFNDFESTPCYPCKSEYGFSHAAFIEVDYSIGVSCITSINLYDGTLLKGHYQWGLWANTNELTIGWTVINGKDSNTIEFKDVNDGYITAQALIARVNDAIKRKGIVTAKMESLAKNGESVLMNIRKQTKKNKDKKEL